MKIKAIIIRLAVASLLLSFAGCTKEVNEKGQTTWRLNTNIADSVEKHTEDAAGILAAITPYFPPAGAAAATIATALGIWRKKIRPNYVKAKTEANLFHTTTHTLIQVIEDVKKNEPEIWSKIRPFLESRLGKNTENAIRAIRGKPAKE